MSQSPSSHLLPSTFRPPDSFVRPAFNRPLRSSSEAFDRIVPLPDLGGSIGSFVIHLPVIGAMLPFKEAGIKFAGLAMIVGLAA